MAKILFISNIAIRVGAFSLASIAAAKEQGMEFFYAANWDKATIEQRREDEEKYGIKLIHIDLVRSPYSLKNIKAYKQLVDFIKKEGIDYIHCNTPVGGLLGRFAGKKCKVKKVIYQAHGFHFYHGSPIINWLIYYPIEKMCARMTDALITINKEDYERAKQFKLRGNGRIYYVPGVGIDLSQYKLAEDIREKKRCELGLKKADVVLISVGELNDNKNNCIIIEAMSRVKNNSIHYILCGEGPNKAKLKELAERKGIASNVHFLGYRTDIKELLKASDIFVMPSFREGLSRSLMEAMASGLPCIVSKIRGNEDLVDKNGGFLCKTDDEEMFIEAIGKLSDSATMRTELGQYNVNKIKSFDFNNICQCLQDIYSETFFQE